MTTQPNSDLWIEDWLSAGRFRTYLDAAGGSRFRALRLYEWNAQLSAAFLHDLAHLEIGFRNACDRQLDAARHHGEFHWTEPKSILTLFPPTARRVRDQPRLRDRNHLPRLTVERARVRAAEAAPRGLLPGKVVAELTFGFWTYLVSDLHEKTIWVPWLHAVFPEGTDRKKLNATLTSLRDFRNRVAHHESILANPEAKRRQLVSVVKLISPELNAHMQEHSQVLAIQSTRP